MKPVVEIKTLCKSFGEKEVLRDLSFDVPGGCVFGFLGPNGAGKTTTISILTGILQPSSGEARVLDQAMTPDNEALRRQIGIVYDSQNLFEQLTAAEHLSFSAAIYEVPAGEIARRRDELLELLDLRDAANSRIRDYSHGMKKKTALACALIHDPKVLFLDEPFEGMDATSTRVVMENLRALALHGTTIFVTSHILDLVERVCDEVAIINGGRCVYQEPVAAPAARGRALEDAFVRLTSGGRQAGRISWAEQVV
jgi:ABC-2 type transport system ATP-binding protein